MASDIEAPLRDEEIFDKFNRFTIRYAEFFGKAAVSINDSADTQDAILLRVSALELRMTLLESRVTYLEGLTIVTAVDVTIDNTVTGHQTVVCTAELTVKLDATPNDRDTAIIKVGQKNTRVIIDGNGKLIEEDATMTLKRRSTKRQIGMDLEYSASLDRWFTT